MTAIKELHAILAGNGSPEKRAKLAAMAHAALSAGLSEEQARLKLIAAGVPGANARAAARRAFRSR